MQLERIISLGNRKVRLQLLAMERSLRATGSTLPLHVIPYDDDLFDLPPNATWWSMPEILDWLVGERTHPMMRKYQCLTTENYQYVDADVCFLRNPEEVLQTYGGFVAACTDWCKPEWTFTPQSARWMYQRTSTWRKCVFNAGQFACDRPLYAPGELMQRAMSADFIDTCVRFRHHDQPGMNMLVFDSGVPFQNLTLPPTCMESTWAGDYPGEYQSCWGDLRRKPYLIHWAGPIPEIPRAIDRIFLDFLSPEELREWDAHAAGDLAGRQKRGYWPLGIRLLNRLVRAMDGRFAVTWRADEK